MGTKEIDYEFQQGRSSGWHFAYRRLSQGISTVTEIEAYIEKLHPLRGWNEGARAGLREWLDEQASCNGDDDV